MRLLIFIFCVMLLSGCGIRQEIHKDFTMQQHQEIIARACDLPDAPFQVQLKNIAILPENHDQIQIFYTINLSRQDVMLYYEQQMERLGWKLSSQSKVHDAFFYYTKPEKFCAIIVYDNSFAMYVGNK